MQVAGSATAPRTPYEQDYDRLLFSTAVRRLADKTQVFPLERNDSVRTRLTHSLEVSNLARSLATRILRSPPTECEISFEHAPVLVATAGLAHDLGNPPFGHQGEVSISRWFSEHVTILEGISEPLRLDFVNFDGNAQGFRLLTKLQDTLGDYGLDLTAASLAVLMKYTVGSSGTNKNTAGARKHGYFSSEASVADWVREETGIPQACRHPLTWIVESADDIAYSTLDIEDTIKKGLASGEDVLAFLRSEFDYASLAGLTNQLTDDFKRTDSKRFPLSRVREVKASYLRTRLVAYLMDGAERTFRTNIKEIEQYTWSQPLLESTHDASDLCKALKKFARIHAYSSTGVLELETTGAGAIAYLMDKMWESIHCRKDPSDLASRRTSAANSYVYSLISESYRWHFERPLSSATPEEVRYRELQLLSDMISGMTDGFALDLRDRLRRHVD